MQTARKVWRRYGENIYFNRVRGGCNAFCLFNIAKHVINDMWYENQRGDSNNESERIVKTTAKLIVSEIRNQTFDCGYYSDNSSMSDDQENIDWLTHNMKLLMEFFASFLIQQANIGQCITHATRPQSTIPPMLF